MTSPTPGRANQTNPYSGFFVPSRDHGPISASAPSAFLFEFRTTSPSHDLLRCELLDHRSQGFEVRFLLRGTVAYSRGGFPTRDAAVEWAGAEMCALLRNATRPA